MGLYFSTYEIQSETIMCITSFAPTHKTMNYVIEQSIPIEDTFLIYTTKMIKYNH